MFKVGDVVTRKSYNSDIIFKISKIVDKIYFLNGINVRLIADSNEEDSYVSMISFPHSVKKSLQQICTYGATSVRVKPVLSDTCTFNETELNTVSTTRTSTLPKTDLSFKNCCIYNRLSAERFPPPFATQFTLHERDP